MTVISAALAGALGAGRLAVPAGAASRPPHSRTKPLNCDSSFNPYAYPQAAVSACGYQTFRRAATHALPGGGSSYDYRVHGVRVRFYVPGKNFNPGTATNARLNEYGLPPRPAGHAGQGQRASASLARWNTQMRGWKGAVTPPSFLAETRSTADSVVSGNWSGYAVSGQANSYTHAEAWYVEPAFYGSVCSSNAEATWAGIGGYYGDGDGLGQDGTAHNVPGMANHEAWWEIVPGYNIVAVNFRGHPGYLFDASTRWLGNGYRFYFYDYYSRKTLAFDVSSSIYSGDSAEAIAERPLINGSLSNLSNFRTLTFRHAKANGNYFSRYSPRGVRHGIHMSDVTGRDMADPSTIGSYGNFTVKQRSCY